MSANYTLQEKLLAMLSEWNYKIAKPFKQFLNGEVSMEMYLCIQALRWYDGTMTMTDFARITRMPKQQMTKLVNRLVEQELVRRIYEPSDRRIIKIQLTEKAMDYIDGFLKNEAGCFRPLLDMLSEEDKAQFKQALIMLHGVLNKIPYDWNEG